MTLAYKRLTLFSHYLATTETARIAKLDALTFKNLSEVTPETALNHLTPLIHQNLNRCKKTAAKGEAGTVYGAVRAASLPAVMHCRHKNPIPRLWRPMRLYIIKKPRPANASSRFKSLAQSILQ